MIITKDERKPMWKIAYKRFSSHTHFILILKEILRGKRQSKYFWFTCTRFWGFVTCWNKSSLTCCMPSLVNCLPLCAFIERIVYSLCTMNQHSSCVSSQMNSTTTWRRVCSWTQSRRMKRERHATHAALLRRHIMCKLSTTTTKSGNKSINGFS